MGFSEKIEEMAVRKERERGRKDIEKLFIYLENCEIEGFKDVLTEIKDLKKSELYEKIINAVTVDRLDPEQNRKFTFEEGSQVRLLKAARGVLSFGGLLTNIFSSSIISLRDVTLIHVYLESIYYVESGKPLKWDDSLNVYFSGLDEHIVFALDKFDEVYLEDLPEPTPEYFEAIKKVRWKDRKTKKFYAALTELMQETTNLVLNYPNLDVWIKRISEYKAIEDLFILTIAGCSAVNDGRLEIEAEDVVMAYKTFFKLIKTDVTKYKAIPERVQGIDGYRGNVKHEGYLVCESCGGYYELQSGESPEDFSDVCECGGELLYKMSLEE